MKLLWQEERSTASMREESNLTMNVLKYPDQRIIHIISLSQIVPFLDKLNNEHLSSTIFVVFRCYLKSAGRALFLHVFVLLYIFD